MRLSEQTRLIISQAVAQHICEDAQVWLFGSRCDDQAKGGDIDLYIESEAVDSPLMRRITLKIALLQQLGEQKIDIIYHNRALPLQPIHEIAKTEGILLN